ncbi:hypothetical protein [Methylovulum psychrotolerans]|uniref:hypothetical protein n=1 Tax=Methylovulum psychrotolerans TaxID=1704499 RepID=UPI001E29E7DF|nr:hypothetical protein [Methylovulum psychrotolerans]
MMLPGVVTIIFSFDFGEAVLAGGGNAARVGVGGEFALGVVAMLEALALGVVRP